MKIYNIYWIHKKSSKYIIQTVTTSFFYNENIPQLRFLYFNEQWTETKLGLISSIQDGTHKNVEKGKYLLSAENIEKG